METKKKKGSLVRGPISPEFIAGSIQKHQHKHTIGGHDIFLGQVRGDEIDGKKVKAIEYTAYEEMAEKKIHEIREDAFEKFDLTCSHIYHSYGTVPVGGICFFVFISAPHRDHLHQALDHLVERIKFEVPIWGKEILEEGEYVWKEQKKKEI